MYIDYFRVVSKPPYEVSESGWGEFEIQIKIYFNDLTEKPVTIYHGLKLFHTNEAQNVFPQILVTFKIKNLATSNCVKEWVKVSLPAELGQVKLKLFKLN